MSQIQSGPPPIVYILLLALLGFGGYWFFVRTPENQSDQPSLPSEGVSARNDPSTPLTPSQFTVPGSLPSGTRLNLQGSTAMVSINSALKQGFEEQFSGVVVTTSATGSGDGISAVLSGNADLGASSRPLRSEEQAQGLVAVPIAEDAIALVVGVNNPFGQGLSQQDAVDIFTGQITNWSEIGGPDKPIRVLNRPPVSGTHQTFREVVLNGSNFGNTPNITTLERDATTPMLRALGNDGIGYATAAQIFNQSTVRPVAIDGLTPMAAQYPYRRNLYYVYKDPANETVQAFLGYAFSDAGQAAIARAAQD
ncbi:phosphate ABC transporter substrate-binding protein [Sodalinema gerasimenkoae]|uniref:phosphate ABC transporter substrate-binding protein n=1 Tax=Sodalinema gerasimenkoae TaxID=2862348 RepID=UPI001356B0A3|nr:phosphate ABC transporter substrate-binding protein [Sodalinema gerasimenkoae]